MKTRRTKAQLQTNLIPITRTEKAARFISKNPNTKS